MVNESAMRKSETVPGQAEAEGRDSHSPVIIGTGVAECDLITCQAKHLIYDYTGVL